MYIAKVDGSLKIGALYFDGTNNEIGRISTFEWEKYLFPSATIVPESQLVTTTTVNLLNNNNNLNILTEIDNVQFGDNAIGRPLFDVTLPVLGLATNHTIVGVGTTATSIFRTSSFSSFARGTVPAGRGKIRGVLTKFGSTFQFYIRNLEDFKLSNPRTYPFSVASTEGFESFATNQKIFSNYLNFSTEGTKDWIVRSGKVLEMSAFGGAIERNKSYFMVPVDMTAANTFSFQVNIQFYANRQVLRVFRTMDYVPGMKIKDATLVDISGNLSIPIENTVGMVSAGTYNIPSTVIGNGYFVFEYTGSNLTSETVITTNVQIDNIVIN